MGRYKNVIVAQSGGTTSVINNSLRGIIEACRDYNGHFGTVYAGYHGVEGILREELLNLSAQSEEETALLRTTPAAGSIGTCRYKLKENQQEDFERIVEVIKAHEIGYLFYIGGNDSMDTVNKISILANKKGLDLTAVGVPKTIDNDVGDSGFKLIDHTPGYGSIARYWAMAVQNANEENAGSCPADPVLILQTFGRKIGFVTAAARLADPGRELPLLICLPESNICIEELADRISERIKASGRAIVVVNEGIQIGDIGDNKDAFGHTQFSSSKSTAAQLIANYLNSKGLKTHGSARCQAPGTDQRSAMYLASAVDLDEAYKLGQKAVVIAAEDGNGYMSTLIRKPGLIYNVEYDKVPLALVANSERSFPDQWITPDKTDVTDDFVKYARPLIGEDPVGVPIIGGLMRFTRFKPVFAAKKLKEYTPQAYR